MRNAILFLFVCCLTHGQTCEIARGTPLIFEAIHAIDYSTARPGDDVPLALAPHQRICGPINGMTLPVGMPAHATVAHLTPRRIQLRLQQIEFPDHGLARVVIQRNDQPLFRTAALLKVDRWTITHPAKSLTTNLGPVPLILLGLTPLIAAEDAVRFSLRPFPAKSSTLKAGTKIVVVIAQPHIVHL